MRMRISRDALPTSLLKNSVLVKKRQPSGVGPFRPSAEQKQDQQAIGYENERITHGRAWRQVGPKSVETNERKFACDHCVGSGRTVPVSPGTHTRVRRSTTQRFLRGSTARRNVCSERSPGDGG